MLLGCATTPNTPPPSASAQKGQTSNKGQAAKGQFSKGVSPTAQKTPPAAKAEASVKPTKGQKPLATETAENVAAAAEPNPASSQRVSSPKAVPKSQITTNREDSVAAAKVAKARKADEALKAREDAKAEKAKAEQARKDAKDQQARDEQKAREDAKAEKAKVEQARKDAKDQQARDEQKAREDARAEKAKAEQARKDAKEQQARDEQKAREDAKAEKARIQEANARLKAEKAEKAASVKPDEKTAEVAKVAEAKPEAPETPAETPAKKTAKAAPVDVPAKGGSSVVIPTQDLKGKSSADLGAPPAAPSGNRPTPATLDMLTPPAPEEFRIGPGDVLKFHSADDPSLDSPAVVRYDGYISLPLIKDVKVSGLTREEATALLFEAYKAYFKEPEVSLSVTEAKSRQYWVMGDVTRPAPYPYTQPVSLLEAISMAGGLRVSTRSSDAYVGAQGQLMKAFLFRHSGGKRQVYDFDLTQIKRSGPHVADTLLLPGDIVYVPESMNLVYVVGEVRQPNAYPLTEDMTLLQLLARSGGVVESTGRMKDVAVIHQVDENNTQVSVYDVREMLKTGGDVRVYPGDIIYVSRKKLTKAQEFAQRLTGSILPYVNLQQQVFSLYSQAYDAWYTRERYDRLFDDSSSNNLSLDQTIRDLAAIRTLTQSGAK